MTPRVKSANDEGLGLVELIIAIVVSGIVVAAMATIFINSWQAQKDVLSVSEATNRGQFVGSAIEKAVRNAVYMDVATGVDGVTLRVRTSLGAECQGFFLGDVTTADGVVTSVSTISNSGSLLPEASSWPVWEPAIVLDSAESFIARTGNTVSYSLVIETDSAPVRIDGEVAQRTIPTGGHPCW